MIAVVILAMVGSAERSSSGGVSVSGGNKGLPRESVGRLSEPDTRGATTFVVILFFIAILVKAWSVGGSTSEIAIAVGILVSIYGGAILFAVLNQRR